MIFANNMEDIESILTRDLLIRSGLEVYTLSIDKKAVTTSHNLVVLADMIINDIVNIQDFVLDFKALIIPGGPYIKQNLNAYQLIQPLIMEFNKHHFLIACICAAPKFLIEAGMIKNKYTAFQCFHAVNNVLYLESKKVVQTKNIITSRSAGTSFAFSFAIIKYLLGRQKLAEIKRKVKF